MFVVVFSAVRSAAQREIGDCGAKHNRRLSPREPKRGSRDGLCPSTSFVSRRACSHSSGRNRRPRHAEAPPSSAQSEPGRANACGRIRDADATEWPMVASDYVQRPRPHNKLPAGNRASNGHNRKVTLRAGRSPLGPAHPLCRGRATRLGAARHDCDRPQLNSDAGANYLMSHGIREDEASKLIINGFIEPIIKELRWNTPSR
jgi:hypothetical protein